MTFSEELAIQEALRNGDGRLMAETVRRMHFTDYSEFEQMLEALTEGEGE